MPSHTHSLSTCKSPTKATPPVSSITGIKTAQVTISCIGLEISFLIKKIYRRRANYSDRIGSKGAKNAYFFN